MVHGDDPLIVFPRVLIQPHGWPVLVVVRIDSVLVQRPKPLPRPAHQPLRQVRSRRKTTPHSLIPYRHRHHHRVVLDFDPDLAYELRSAIRMYNFTEPSILWTGKQLNDDPRFVGVEVTLAVALCVPFGESVLTHPCENWSHGNRYPNNDTRGKPFNRGVQR